MKSEFDYVFFDGDGTLFDSMASIHASAEFALNTVLKRELAFETISRFGGHTLPDTLRLCVGEECEESVLDQLVRAYEVHHDANPTTVLAYPGVVETLHRIKDSGKKMTIVTTRGFGSLTNILRQNEMESFFDSGNLVTGDFVRNFKPHPEPVNRAKKLLGVQDPRRVIMVGDTDKDIISGYRAGVWTMGVTYGHMDPAEMRALPQADFFADSFREAGTIILGR